MKIKKRQPDFYIYNSAETEFLGKVISPNNLVVDYNFNSASKITFTVNKKIYDERTRKWIDNPCYDKLIEHKVIVSSDTENKVKFTGKKILTTTVNGETVGDYGGLSTQPNPRNVYATGLGFNVRIKNASLQNEIELFDIGKSSGYSWDYYAYLNSTGAFVQDTKSTTTGGNPKYYAKIACSNFFPVEVGDIIGLGSKLDSNMHYNKNGNPYYYYTICYYSDNKAPSYVETLEASAPNPISRIHVSSGVFGTSEETGAPATSGYMRICAEVVGATYNNGAWSSSAPAAGFVKIYSGERRCTNFSCGSKQTAYLQNNKWIVQNIEEEKHSSNAKKTVTLYSYEYVLSQRCFSIDETTLPLFIPDEIPNYINSEDCVIDATTDNGTYRQWQHRQRMPRGLINQILDYMPDWEVGYINPKVCVRYRTISEVDNDNIYAFLINTVQPLYKCFILFDNTNKTINILDIDDICKIDSGSILTWSNAIKSLEVSSIDTNYITAMRVHTSEDTYGLGLINPTGSNVIYNFDSVLDDLDYVVDSTHLNPNNNNEPFTIKELIIKYQDELESVKAGTTQYFNSLEKNSYPNLISDLVNYTKKYVELNSKLSESLTTYKTVGDTINVYLESAPNNSYPTAYSFISDYPRTVASMKSGGDYAPIYNESTGNRYDNYSSQSLYCKLLAAAEAYWATYNELKTVKTRLRNVNKYLQYYATYFSFNYKKVSDDWDRYIALNNPNTRRIPPIFTPQEIKVLTRYIFEGDWTDNNAIFKDDYDKSDIINTLTETFGYAKDELDSIYSKPNYEFKINSVNIFANNLLKELVNNIYIGNSLTISDEDNWIFPILLGVHIDYSNETNFSLTLTTDYKRKPLDVRFSELFGTISQVSPSTVSLTYDG